MRTCALSLALALGGAVAAVAAEPLDAPEDEMDELVVLGVKPGVFEPVPGASTDWIATDAFTGEHKDLAELLGDAPGVFVRRFGAAGDRSEVSIRGSTAAQVVVTLDGVRANSALTGGVDLSRVCLPLLEQVEITRGAGTAQLGSGAIGGVVNLSTRAAGAGRRTRAQFSAGSFDTFEGSIFHADRHELLDYSFGYCGLGTEGDFDFLQPTERGDGVQTGFQPRRATRLNNRLEQHVANLGLGTELGPGQLRLTSYFVHAEGGEPGFDGGVGRTAGQNTEAESRDLLNLAQLRWEGRPHPWLGDELELALHHRYERADFEDPAGLEGAPLDLRTRLQTAGLRQRQRWRRAFGLQQAELGLLLDGSHDRLRARDRASRRRESGAVAVDGALRLWAERVVVSASLRFEATDGFVAQWLPQVGLVLHPWPWLRLRGQAGRAYRVPNFDELFHPEEEAAVGNPDLEPEDAWNYGVGVELVWAELGPLRDAEVGAHYFRREIDESIVWLRTSPSRLRPENLGEATAEGVELSARFGLTRFARFSAHHTLTESERDATGRRLPAQPERETLGRVELGLPWAWKLVGEVQDTGSILVNEGGSLRIPARTVWNASAALNLVEVPGLPFHRVARELWVYADLNNLGDEAVRDSASFPQPGRNASFGLEGRW